MKIIALLVVGGAVGYAVSRLIGKDTMNQLKDIADDAWSKADLSTTAEQLKGMARETVDIAREKVPEMRDAASEMVEKTAGTISGTPRE